MAFSPKERQLDMGMPSVENHVERVAQRVWPGGIFSTSGYFVR